METLEKTAESYEELLVPPLFDAWARRMVEAADVKRDSVVLDVACGTGVLARRLKDRLGSSGSVVGIDINPGMLAVARRKAPEIDWFEGSAEALPFGDETFDAVFCQFGLMLFSSPSDALVELRRVLKRRGEMFVLVFDSIRNNRAYETMAGIYDRVVDSSVGDTLRFPFSMGDTRQLAALFEDAGISDVQITTQRVTARFSSARHMVLADVKGWFPFADIRLDEQTLQAVVEAAEHGLDPFRTADGTVEFEVSAHMISAVKS